jgi:RHS repeat-associated protein
MGQNLTLRLYSWLFIFGANIFFINNSYGQLVLDTANTKGTYTAPHSIVLNPGFSADGAVGAFSASIVALPIVNCVALNATLSTGQNYIVTYVPRQAFTDPASLSSKNTCEVMQTVQYFDGLGRPLQNVQVKASPSARDIVTPVVYDSYGRESTKFSPYAALSTNSDGSFKTNAISDQASFYNNPSNPLGWNAPGVKNTNFPFSQTLFEASPLNRPLEQGATGEDWQLSNNTSATNRGHTIKMDYATNDASSLTTGSKRWAKLYSVSLDVDGKPTLVDNGSYGANELYVDILKDENWQNSDGKAGTSEEYKDKDGRTILNRVFNTGEVPHSTYYVFDDFGNLSFVIPPSANPDSGYISQTTLDKLCFQYRYDGRQRMIEKKIPGKGREYMVYNKIDMLVASQDSLKRVNKQWAYIKYDAFGKPLLTGIWDNSGTLISRDNLQSQVDGLTVLWETKDISNSGNFYYTSNTFPTSGGNILTVNYYDDYNIPNLPSIYDKHTIYSSMTRGLITATLTNVLGSGDMLWSTHYYDDKANIVKTIAQNYIGGNAHFDVSNYDEFNNVYDFTNNMTSSIRTHHVGTNPVLTIIDSLEYDNAGRKSQAWKQINGGANILMYRYEYNEIGQVLIKHMHSTDNGTSFLQDINYNYNERGWETRDSSRLFVMQLKYNDGSTPQYNGNISNQYWGTGNSLTKNYTYNYDKLNRLLSGISNENYTEQNISYDKTGNILTLTRVDPRIPTTTNYSFSYDGNHLLNVSGLNTNTYLYDGNGNAKYDAHNNVNIDYNILNLPASISGSKTIVYAYDADGNKLSRASANTTFGTVEYDDGVQYFNGTIDFIKTDEGIIKRRSDGSYHYEYTLSDNLGNNRVSFDDSSHVARVVQKDDYYPYGLNYNRYTFGDKNNYLYNKKELQEELGQYDYGARFYDPTIGRFLVIDKYAEKYQGLSTYQYAALNPIKNIDMNGDSVWNTTSSTAHGKDVHEVRTTHITGKVLNNAFSTVSANDLAGSLNNKLNSQTATETYKNANGGTTTVEYKIDAKFQGASSINQVDKSDNLVVIVNKVEGKADQNLAPGSKAGGLSQTGGKVAYVEAGSGLESMTNLAFHEVGHELGLEHPKVNDSADPMSYTGQKANFKNSQVIDIYHNASSSSGMLNQGVNRVYITNKQNVDSNGDAVSRTTSTNSHPYVGDRRYGMAIPKPIVNN